MPRKDDIFEDNPFLSKIEDRAEKTRWATARVHNIEVVDTNSGEAFGGRVRVPIARSEDIWAFRKVGCGTGSRLLQLGVAGYKLFFHILDILEKDQSWVQINWQIASESCVMSRTSVFTAIGQLRKAGVLANKGHMMYWVNRNVMWNGRGRL